MASCNSKNFITAEKKSSTREWVDDTFVSSWKTAPSAVLSSLLKPSRLFNMYVHSKEVRFFTVFIGSEVRTLTGHEYQLKKL